MFDFIFHVAIIVLQLFTLSILLGKNPMEKLSKSNDTDDVDVDSKDANNLLNRRFTNSRLLNNIFDENIQSQSPTNLNSNLGSFRAIKEKSNNLLSDVLANDKMSLFTDKTKNMSDKSIDKKISELSKDTKMPNKDPFKEEKLDRSKKDLVTKESSNMSDLSAKKKSENVKPEEKSVKNVKILDDKSKLFSGLTTESLESYFDS